MNDPDLNKLLSSKKRCFKSRNMLNVVNTFLLSHNSVKLGTYGLFKGFFSFVLHTLFTSEKNIDCDGLRSIDLQCLKQLTSPTNCSTTTLNSL